MANCRLRAATICSRRATRTSNELEPVALLDPGAPDAASVEGLEEMPNPEGDWPGEELIPLDVPGAPGELMPLWLL